jgi:hypothetical protein
MRAIHVIMLSALVLSSWETRAADTASTPVGAVGDLASLLEGEFTTEPASMDRAAGPPPPGPVYYDLAKRVEVPALGADVVYSELRENGPQGKIIRQRLYALKLDADGGKIVMKSYSFANKADLAGSQNIATPLAKLDPADLQEQPAGCSIEWRKTDAGFEGAIPPGSCKAASPASSSSTAVMGVSKTNLMMPIETEVAAPQTTFRRLR